MSEIEALMPKRPESWLGVRVMERLTGAWIPSCEVCGHRASTRRVVVYPRTLARGAMRLCNRRGCREKVAAWQGATEARRARAMNDYEHENGIVMPHDLKQGIPPQYPSISRATLRAFLDSGLIAATVAGSSSPSALQGSIESLGFGNEVYAEVRSGQTVLRRVMAA